MAHQPRIEPLAVCVDADVIIAGLLSRAGASHALLVLGEIGLIELVIPESAIQEVRRNLLAKLPEAAPLFEEFLQSVPLQIQRAGPEECARARHFADAKDVPILAAALSAGASLLVTHNVRHFRSGEGVRIIRPKVLIEEARAWLRMLGK